MNKQFFKQLHLSLVLSLMILLVSCRKENAIPIPPGLPDAPMEYFDFNNHEIKDGLPGFSVDLNHDNRKDIFFSTLWVGDPVDQVDKLLFLIQSNIKVNLPINDNEQIPVMHAGDPVPLNDFNGYQWFELASITMVKKIISFTQPPVWEGAWRNAHHSYIPYQIVNGADVYGGWVDVSVDITNEQVIIHRGALCKQPNKMIKAGM